MDPTWEVHLEHMAARSALAVIRQRRDSCSEPVNTDLSMFAGRWGHAQYAGLNGSNGSH